MTTEPKEPAPWDLAAQDAMVYGIGVMVIHSNGEIKHISPEEYHTFAETLNEAQGYYVLGKKLPKK